MKSFFVLAKTFFLQMSVNINSRSTHRRLVLENRLDFTFSFIFRDAVAVNTRAARASRSTCFSSTRTRSRLTHPVIFSWAFDHVVGVVGDVGPNGMFKTEKNARVRPQAGS
jgi:hypothetical protein